MKRRDFVKMMAVGSALSAARAKGENVNKTCKLGVSFGTLLPDEPVAIRERIALESTLERFGRESGITFEVFYRGGARSHNDNRTIVKQLLSLDPNILLTRGTDTTAAAIAETRSVPIIFVNVTDPVGEGFVTSISRPAGNVTGFTNVEASMGGKWVEALFDIAPDINTIEVLLNPVTAPRRGEFFQDSLQSAARSFAAGLRVNVVSSLLDIQRTVVRMSEQRRTGLIVNPGVGPIKETVALVNQSKVVAVYPFSIWVEEGGLASYGIDTIDLFRRASGYITRAFRGDSPGDLPVQAPTKFELAVNLRTAKATGVVLPDLMIANADRVLE